METSERLRFAVVNGKLRTVKLMIERHPHLLENVDPTNGWSNLHYATCYGHYDICVFLVSQGHDRDEVSLTHTGDTALHVAASKNQEKTLHYLAQHIQRSTDWRNANHHTALMVATVNGHDPCVNILLDFGADMDKGDDRNTRPLHVASAYGHVKILRTLVDRGADGLTPNGDGWSPVDFGFSPKVQTYLRSLIYETINARKNPAMLNGAPSTPVNGKFFGED